MRCCACFTCLRLQGQRRLRPKGQQGALLPPAPLPPAPQIIGTVTPLELSKAQLAERRLSGAACSVSGHGLGQCATLLLEVQRSLPGPWAHVQVVQRWRAPAGHYVTRVTTRCIAVRPQPPAPALARPCSAHCIALPPRADAQRSAEAGSPRGAGQRLCCAPGRPRPGRPRDRELAPQPALARLSPLLPLRRRRLLCGAGPPPARPAGACQRAGA
jgi:hypothetical protein